jgi:hypothetical protein
MTGFLTFQLRNSFIHFILVFWNIEMVSMEEGEYSCCKRTGFLTSRLEGGEFGTAWLDRAWLRKVSYGMAWHN